jgi:phage shock protein PspC (stress-responsive transcriptional regulator)
MNEVKQHFASYKDNFEIITDIENRIAEMFSDLLVKENKQVIVLSDVNLIISRMGNPSDFEAEEEDEQHQPDFEKTTERKFFRDMEDRVIGGVCAGIGHYFNIEAKWIRIAFLILLIFKGFGLIPYLLLWIVIPKANSRTERMEMKGEKINLQAFQKNVEDELAAVKTNFLNATDHARPSLNRLGSFIRDIITALTNLMGTTGKLLIKALGFLIITIMCGLVVSAFVLLLVFLGYAGSADINGIFPLNALRESLRPIVFVATFLVLFIPLLGIIFFTLRVFFNNTTISRSIGFSLLMIWILALGTGIFYIAKNATDFKEKASFSESINLKSNTQNVYYLVGGEEHTLKEDIFNVDGNDRVVTITRSDKDFDTPNSVNIDLKIADNEFPSIVKTYSARGINFNAAINNAHEIEYYHLQKDSLLTFDYQSGLKDNSLWRDQQVNIKLNIPINSTLYIETKLAKRFFRNQMNDCINDDESVKYIIVKATKDGFVCEKTVDAMEWQKQNKENNDPKDSVTKEITFH